MAKEPSYRVAAKYFGGTCPEGFKKKTITVKGTTYVRMTPMGPKEIKRKGYKKEICVKTK